VGVREPGRSRRPRRGGRARSDAERRRLAQASRERALDERSGDVVVWCDGGSRGNPGPAAFAYVLDVPGGRSVSASEAIGRATVNVAELRAVLAALAHAGELGLRGVEVRLDARLVAQQLAGERTPRNPELRRLVEAVRQAAVAVRPVRYRWIPREANGRANALVARVLGTAGESA
jgi:probable phosphoglycerate mutase